MAKKFLARNEIMSLAFNQNDPCSKFEGALLVGLLGTATNSLIFQYLMDKLEELDPEEDTLVITDAQFARETRLSIKTIERSRKILREAGFDIWVKKNAEGNPTNHYRFNLERFQAFVAEFLGVSVDQIQVWMENPLEEEAIMDALWEQTAQGKEEREARKQ